MPKLPKCKACGGTGRVMFSFNPKAISEVEIDCTSCDGTGIRPATLTDLHEVVMEILELMHKHLSDKDS